MVHLRVRQRKRSRTAPRAGRRAEKDIRRRDTELQTTTMKDQTPQVKDSRPVASWRGWTLDISTHRNECQCRNVNIETQRVSVQTECSHADRWVAVSRHFIRPRKRGDELHAALRLPLHRTAEQGCHEQYDAHNSPPPSQKPKRRARKNQQSESAWFRHQKNLAPKLAIRLLGRRDVDIPKTAFQFADLRVSERKRPCPKRAKHRAEKGVVWWFPKTAA